MALYQFEKGIADLNAARSQDQATQDYAHFVGQQRFSRQNDALTQGFQRSFPQFTGHYAPQLGSGVQSGVMRDKLTQHVGDFNRSQDQLNQDRAGFEGNFATGQTNSENAYQKALQMLNDQLSQARLGVDPFASYVGA